MRPNRQPKNNLHRLDYLLISLVLITLILGLSPFLAVTQAYIAPKEHLRWNDVLTIGPGPLLVVLIHYLIKRDIEYRGSLAQASYFGANLTFIAGISLFSIGCGVFNYARYLETVVCQNPLARLCRTVFFGDQTLGRTITYAGVVLFVGSLIAIEQYRPSRLPVKKHDVIMLGTNAVAFAATLFIHLASGLTDYHLFMLTLIPLFALITIYLRRFTLELMPFTLFVAASYTIGIESAAIFRAFA